MSAQTLQVILLTHTPNPEQAVAMSARLCYSDAAIEEIAQGVEASSQANYLQKLVQMGHLSPVEHASFTFGIEGVSRSLLAQLTRHRIASFSVKSQRYVGAQSQGGDTFGYIVPQGVQALGAQAVARFEGQMRQMQHWYDQWVADLGVGEHGYEDARFVLPNAAETKLILTMNARELLHFFKLRCCNRAQWEIRTMAHEMLTLVKAVAPNLFAKAGPACIGGPCSEGRMTCGRMQEVRAQYTQRFGKGGDQ